MIFTKTVENLSSVLLLKCLVMPMSIQILWRWFLLNINTIIIILVHSPCTYMHDGAFPTFIKRPDDGFHRIDNNSPCFSNIKTRCGRQGTEAIRRMAMNVSNIFGSFFLQNKYSA